MKTISTRVSEEVYSQLLEYCSTKATSLSELITSALDGLLEGKIKIRARTSQISARCPECGFSLFYHATESDGPHVFCARCGWWSQIKLPEKWKKGELVLAQTDGKKANAE